MKKHICALLTLSMSIMMYSAQAQEFRLGVSAGTDASRMAVAGGTGGPLKYRTELTGGAHVEALLSPTVGLQLEVNYSAQGAGLVHDDGTVVGSYRLDYLTVPVLVKLYGTPRLSFFAGPQAGFLLGAKTQLAGDPKVDAKEDFKSTDFYGVLGAEYRFDNGIFISGRYNIGLTNVYDAESDPDNEIKNRYFNFRIGYSFKLGK